MYDEPVPDEQDGKRPEGRGDEAGTLVQPIPAEGLADEGRQKGTCDSKHGGQNETARTVRSWRKHSRNDAGNEADHDDPDEARHENLPCEFVNATIGSPRRDSAKDVPIQPSGRTLKPLVAFAVISAALLDPLQPAIVIASLVRVVLIETRLHAGLAGRFI